MSLYDIMIMCRSHPICIYALPCPRMHQHSTWSVVSLVGFSCSKPSGRGVDDDTDAMLMLQVSLRMGLIAAHGSK